MCNKVGFETRKEANYESRLLKAKHRRDNDKAKKLRAYDCPLCKLWHLTTLSKNVTRRFTVKNS